MDYSEVLTYLNFSDGYADLRQPEVQPRHV